GALGFKQRQFARTSGGQYGYAQADKELPQPWSAANFRMMAEEEWRVNAKWLLATAGLAGETRAVERQAVHRAQHRGRNLLRAEEFLRQRLHIFARDGFDGCQELIERVELAEIQSLPRQ